MVLNQVCTGTPHYFTRYEDMTNNSTLIMTEVFKFILGTPTLQGTVLEKRINDVTSQGFAKQAVYTLKSTVTLNKCIHLYTEEQLTFIKTELKEFMYYFGYVDIGQEDNLTPFFKYDDQNDKDVQNYNGFKQHNATVLESLAK